MLFVRALMRANIVEHIMTHNQDAMILAHRKGVAMARSFCQVGPITTAEYNQASELAHSFKTSEEHNAFMAGFRGERIRYASWRQFAH